MREIREPGQVPILLWDEHVTIEPEALAQVRATARLPIVGPHLAVMPDAHWGIGATVGSVVPTRAAIIPAAVGVDIGCGMRAVRTTLDANRLDLPRLFAEIEECIPVGGPGVQGSWAEARHAERLGAEVPPAVSTAWLNHLHRGYGEITLRHPKLARNRHGGLAPDVQQLGTLGTGNHFIEVCVEAGEVAQNRGTAGEVWLLLHSGSRGPGNRIGTYFIEQAKAQRRERGDAPALADSADLAWLDDDSREFRDYLAAVTWAQDYARLSRGLMMQTLLDVLSYHVMGNRTRPSDFVVSEITDCHHNYVSRELHLGEWLYVTRKGAVSARQDQLGIIPGSMGAKSYIVRGRGAPASFTSCSHGAGRRMSRGQAKREITLEQHAAATAGIQCRKDAGVLDESPAAYKDIDAVMASQPDLVTVEHELRQILCVKG